MRKAAVEELFEIAKTDHRILFAASDISESVVAKFRDELPRQFFMEGIAEGHLIGMASGLAKEGNCVFVNTITSFLTRRCLEQIMVNVCLEGANVKLLGQGGGLVYGRHGPTHHANEDIALMRALPEMKVIAPCDVEQTRRAVKWAALNDGPVYIRLSKGNVPVVTAGLKLDEKKVVVFSEPKDVLFITTGSITQVVLEVAEQIPGAGVIGVPFLKPFPEEELMKWVGQVNRLVVLEEHSEVGGLFSCVSEAIVRRGRALPAVLSLSLPDAFLHKYGRQEELWREYGLDAETAYQQVRRWLDQ